MLTALTLGGSGGSKIIENMQLTKLGVKIEKEGNRSLLGKFIDQEFIKVENE